MKIMKGYVFRMYSNKEQINIIEKSFGCSKYIYNLIKKISKLTKEKDMIFAEKLNIKEMGREDILSNR